MGESGGYSPPATASKWEKGGRALGGGNGGGGNGG